MIAITKRPGKLIAMVETPVTIIGPELTNDPNFIGNGPWYQAGVPFATPVTITAGLVDVTTLSGDVIATDTFTVAGKVYQVEIVVSSITGTGTVSSGITNVGTVNAVGTHKFTYAQESSSQRIVLLASSASTLVITKFSVKEVIEDDVIVDINSMWTSAYNPIVYEFEISGVSDPTYYNIIEVHQKGVGLVASNRYKPEGNGKMLVDISSFLKPLIRNNYGYLLAGEINKKSDKDSLEFFIKYSENALNSVGSIISDEGQSFFCSNSVRQIGSSQNMFEYVPVGKGDIEAKWLTESTEPTYFQGYPFNLNFIYSELIAGSELKVVVTYMDINKSILGIHEYDLDETQARGINYLRLDDVYPDNVAYVSWVLKSGAPTPEGYVSMGYVAPGYTE